MKALVLPLVWSIRVYQIVGRAVLPPACKFTPSCSDYAITALRTHGVFRGLGLALWRILRCNPFSTGGYDPVPDKIRACCRDAKDIEAH